MGAQRAEKRKIQARSHDSIGLKLRDKKKRERRREWGSVCIPSERRFQTYRSIWKSQFFVPRCTSAANIICTSASFCESTIVTSRHCIADAVNWRQLQTLGYSRTKERIDDNPNAERKNEQSSKQLQTVRQILKQAQSPTA